MKRQFFNETLAYARGSVTSLRVCSHLPSRDREGAKADKRFPTVAYVALALLVVPVMSWAALEDRQTIEKSFTLPAGARTIEIRGHSGEIKVNSASGDRARFSIAQHLKADRQEKFDELKNEVKVEFTQEGSKLIAEVYGPWRCEDKRGRRCWVDWDGKGTTVTHDFTVTVPADSRMEIRNINGAISVDGVRGGYALKTINGPVELKDAAGAGSVETVNGALRASYSRNPQQDVSFKTINGKIEVWLQPDLNADFRMKTLNGKIFTDFDMTMRASSEESSSERKGKKWVFRSDRQTNVRAGNGGPVIEISGLNSEILIHSAAKARK